MDERKIFIGSGIGPSPPGIFREMQISKKRLASHCDIGNIVPMKQTTKTKTVVRVQIGARMEKTLVKTLKALAEYLDLSLGDLLEGITLHALEGKPPFSKQTLGHIRKLRTIYVLELTARDSHRLVEEHHASN